jgi:hypothetical protein
VTTDATLDAVLTGLIVLEHPAATEIDDSWLEAPRWTWAVRVLRRHQARGGTLGDLIVAGAVLEAAGVDLPKTTAAEAVLAADLAAPAPWLIERARERALRLRVRRLASLLLDFSRKSVPAIGRALDRAREELTSLAEWAEQWDAGHPLPRFKRFSSTSSPLMSTHNNTLKRLKRSTSYPRGHNDEEAPEEKRLKRRKGAYGDDAFEAVVVAALGRRP